MNYFLKPLPLYKPDLTYFSNDSRYALRFRIAMKTVRRFSINMVSVQTFLMLKCSPNLEISQNLENISQ